MISIRKGKKEDLAEIQHLFVETIATICSADYNPEQIAVWTSSIKNEKRWNDIMTTQFILIAEHKTKIVGFVTLDNGIYIDFLYVHKDYQRQGIAYKLYAEVEKESKRLGQTQLTSDVSKIARPFFESIGFRIKTEQTVERQGIELTNYKMTKILKK